MNQISQELLKAYKATTYSVPELELNIIVDEHNKLLEKFLARQNVKTWAFITAWNPHSRELSLAENQSRNQGLLAQLKSQGLLIYEGVGIPDDEGWIPEESFFVVGVSRQYATKLAVEYGQNAIVFGGARGKAKLILINRNNR